MLVLYYSNRRTNCLNYLYACIIFWKRDIRYKSERGVI